MKTLNYDLHQQGFAIFANGGSSDCATAVIVALTNAESEAAAQAFPNNQPQRGGLFAHIHFDDDGSWTLSAESDGGRVWWEACDILQSKLDTLAEDPAFVASANALWLQHRDNPGLEILA